MTEERLNNIIAQAKVAYPEKYKKAEIIAERIESGRNDI